MSKEEQIEGMAKVLCGMASSCNKCMFNSETCYEHKEAEELYTAGYRKRSEGEWIDTGDFELDNIYSGWKCSLCGYIFCGNKTNFCSNCGAKMKGGAE